MSISDIRSCPRKAYLRTAVDSGIIKAGILRGIVKDVLLSSPFSTGEAALRKRIRDAFDAKADRLLPFEAEAERERMEVLLWRYLEFERRQKNKILAENFVNKVKVMGDDHSVSAHRLIDRGTALECIRYLYKQPEMSYRSRKTPVEKNPDLLALQRTGEAEAAKLGITGKPVFGSFYYLKSSLDTSRSLESTFESRLGSNIINHHFTIGEETALAKELSGQKPDVALCTDDERECYDCIYKDLCHTEFVKRSLEEKPTVEEKPLDSIHMTPSQRRFVEFESGECRVNAVAGSGKTTIVTLRTLRLIEEGCKPEQILMITFTDKACGEMKSRLHRYACGSTLKDLNIETDKIVVRTFNSFGQELLDTHYAKLGFTEAPQLVDEILKKDILSLIHI